MIPAGFLWIKLLTMKYRIGHLARLEEQCPTIHILQLCILPKVHKSLKIFENKSMEFGWEKVCSSLLPVGLAPYKNHVYSKTENSFCHSDLTYITCWIFMMNFLRILNWFHTNLFSMETFHISTMTQISSWWSWFSLWWTVEWLARQCSLTSEVIHSSCCQKGLPAIIGLWLCNIWNNQQRRRQILLLVSDFVLSYFQNCRFFLLLFTIYISQHNLLGRPSCLYD